MSCSPPASPALQQNVDDRFMAIAATLARRGLGRTMPDPSVGAVIMRADGDQSEIVGCGWTQPGGRPHAETQALKYAGARAKGATIYVTLEPCSHQGKTPPCARALIEAGITRVVVAIEDPDKRVAGRGIAMLRGAGIEVTTGVRAGEARWITLGHIRRVCDQRPFVQIKLAVSENYFVSHGQAGEPVWVTGTAARARVHLMRAKADGVLTGIGTVLADNPELTCRLPGLQALSPIRIVMDRNLRLPLGCKLTKSAREVPLWVLCGPDADREKTAQLTHHGVKIIEVDTKIDPITQEPILDWDVALSVLASRGLTRLMVEAGPQIARSLSTQTDLVDEFVLFQGRGLLDETCGTRLSDIWSFDYLLQMTHNKTLLAGGDVMINYRAPDLANPR